MNKKFFALAICIIVIAASLFTPLLVNADELTLEPSDTVGVGIEENADEADSEEIFDDDSNSAEFDSTAIEGPESGGTSVNDNTSEFVEGNNEYHDVFTRVWEFSTSHSEEMISLGSASVLVVMNIILRRSTKKAAKEAKETYREIKEVSNSTFSSQNSVVGAVNNMIDGYNGLSQQCTEMKESYDLYGRTDTERNKVVGATLITNLAILEILATVYPNTRNLPQGVKDIVNMKYAKCLQSLEDDDQLLGIIETVRANIGASNIKAPGIAEPRAVEAARKASEGDAEV